MKNKAKKLSTQLTHKKPNIRAKVAGSENYICPTFFIFFIWNCRGHESIASLFRALLCMFSSFLCKHLRHAVERGWRKASGIICRTFSVLGTIDWGFSKVSVVGKDNGSEEGLKLCVWGDQRWRNVFVRCTSLTHFTKISFKLEIFKKNYDVIHDPSLNPRKIFSNVKGNSP